MIAACVLAAGASRRYGSPKQLESIDGETWVRRTVRFAAESGCAPVLVVVGAEAKRIAAEVEDADGVTVVVHRGWHAGIGTSIAAGARALESLDRTPTGVLLLACDQPALDAGLLRRVIDAFDGAPSSRVACAYAGTVGIPALFGRGWYGRLAGLAGDRGAKALLLERPESRTDVDWPAGALDRDERRDPGG